MIFWDNWDRMTTSVLCDRCSNDITDAARKVLSTCKLPLDGWYDIKKQWTIFNLFKFRVYITIMWKAGSDLPRPPIYKK